MLKWTLANKLLTWLQQIYPFKSKRNFPNKAEAVAEAMARGETVAGQPLNFKAGAVESLRLSEEERFRQNAAHFRQRARALKQRHGKKFGQ